MNAVKAQEIRAGELKRRFSEILQAVQQGRRFYLTRHGKRIAELSPVKTSTKPEFGCGKGIFSRVAADFDSPLEEEFMG